MLGWLRARIEALLARFGDLHDTEDACRCAEGAYLGAQLAGTPIRCERCRCLVDDVAETLLDRIHAESLARLDEWAAANPWPPKSDE